MVFTQNELIVMIGVVSVLLICITILTIIDIKEYLKAKKGVVLEEEVSFGPTYQEEKEEEIAPVNVTIEEEKPEEVLVNTSSTKEEKGNEIFLEELEDEEFDTKKDVVEPIIQEVEENVVQKVEDVKEEVVKKVEEVKEVKDEVLVSTIEKKEKKRLDVLEELSEMEESLPNKKDDVTNFELEQERTAIISLDELMQKSDELYNDNEYVQYDDGNEPITIDEVINRFNRENAKVEEVVEQLEEVKEVPKIVQEVVEEIPKKKVEPYSKKETIPFISSVYGIEKDNALEFENTATYEKLDRAHYNDFAQKLREMNENK